MIGAVIWDMDGCQSDTQGLHAQVESQLLARFGVRLSPDEISAKYAGVRTRDFFVDLLTATGVSFDIDALMAEKWVQMERLANRGVRAVPGAFELTQALNKLGVPQAVASASDTKYVEVVLRSIGTYRFFTAVVGGDQVRQGKPSPESFLLAAARLGVPAARCVVIEDGGSGVLAAEAAGMACVGIRGHDVRIERADVVIDDLRSVLASRIVSLR
ncbi:MAG: HAD family phosphatase [Nanoarchaeota archaeon]